MLRPRASKILPCFFVQTKFLWIFHAKKKFSVFFRCTMYVITFFVVQLVQRASNCFSCVFDTVWQTFVLGSFQMTLSCKAFVNACYCRVHKCILRNVFTDFEHNYAEIWRFLLWDKYIFAWQVTASAVCSALLHKLSHLPDFNPPVSAKHLWKQTNAKCINTYSETFSLTSNIMM